MAGKTNPFSLSPSELETSKMETQLSALSLIQPRLSILQAKLMPKRVCCSKNQYPDRRLIRKTLRDSRLGGTMNNVENYGDFPSIIQHLSMKRIPHVAEKLVLEMQSEGFLPDQSTLSALMLCYANNGLFPQAQCIWDEILNSSYNPSTQMISDLFDAYGRAHLFDEVAKILCQLSLRNSNLLPEVYPLAILCFGKGGELGMMEYTMKEMISKGFAADSKTGNAFVVYYSIFGSLKEMENAYGRLKRSQILIEEEGIRSMGVAYIKKNKFHDLGEFVKDVGLGRRNVGNLLWNLLLVSYAANFKMKSLQREFLNMVEAGFDPDITTFNIRALAFSRMSLFWDLHLSLDHMNHNGVTPDIVTYGCVVDSYIDRRLGRNLDFALNKMNVNDSVLLLTDPIVFEALGKGDFHSSSEALLEFNRREGWTYKRLIAFYFKKKYRSNQVFWNY